MPSSLRSDPVLAIVNTDLGLVQMFLGPEKSAATGRQNSSPLSGYWSRPRRRGGGSILAKAAVAASRASSSVSGIGGGIALQ